MESIPTINLSKEETAKAELLDELRFALLEVGFLYISNHGIPASTINELVDILPPLFSLPGNIKEEAGLIKSPHFLGYSKFGSEMTASKQDQREQFELANELPDVHNESLPLYVRLQGPNQWPVHSSIPNFRTVVETYITALQSLASRFLSLVTEALSLPPDTLSQFAGPQDRLKLVRYRPSSSPSQGVGPHKDSSGWMTFLLQASASRGLQVLAKDGSWIDIPPIPNTLVVNMGQAFEVVTNGVCKATTHRVLLPPGDYNRYSAPFFQGVRPDLTKSDLGKLWSQFGQPKWQTRESIEGQLIDSPFLRGRYSTWGEAQLRTKIRSHRDVGELHYANVFEKYIND